MGKAVDRAKGALGGMRGGKWDPPLPMAPWGSVLRTAAQAGPAETRWLSRTGSSCIRTLPRFAQMLGTVTRREGPDPAHGLTSLVTSPQRSMLVSARAGPEAGV